MYITEVAPLAPPDFSMFLLRTLEAPHVWRFARNASGHLIVAICCPFSQFCEIGISLLSL